MEIKNYLAQVSLLDKEIDAELSELSELKKYALTSRSFVGGGGSGNGVSSVEALVEKICGAEEKINMKIDRLIDKKAEITALIERIDDGEVRSLFKLHYISGLTWDEVAEKQYISLRTAHNIHKRGLKMLETLLGTATA